MVKTGIHHPEVLIGRRDTYLFIGACLEIPGGRKVQTPYFSQTDKDHMPLIADKSLSKPSEAKSIAIA